MQSNLSSRFFSSRLAPCLLTLSVLLQLIPHSPVASRAAASASFDKEAKDRAPAGYAQIPLSFEANRGQADRRVKFLSRGDGYTLHLTDEGAVMSLYPADQPAQSAALRMSLAGANQRPRVTALNELEGKTYYFLGNDPGRWKTGAPNYGKVKYEAVYPGIDLVFYGNQRQLEYDFIIAPNVDPKQIRLSFTGARRMRLDAGGDLILETKAGDVRQHRPVVYQEICGTKREVAGRYAVLGKNLVGFEVGAYDRSQPLVIDPVLSYSTKLSRPSNTRSFSYGIAADSQGNAYLTGVTSQPAYPTTPGAVNVNPGSEVASAAFVTKLNAQGSGLVYSAVFGGSAGDEGNGIAVDAAGNAYVTGVTYSQDFPTTPGAFKRTNSTGQAQAFVVKLSADGGSIVFSTYLGGDTFNGRFETPRSTGNGIAVDAQGNVYVAGNSGGVFPTTPGAFQPNFTPGTGGFTADAYVTRLSADGSRLLYSTFLGSGGNDSASSIALDPAGNIYVSGSTTNGHTQNDLPLNARFPVTQGAYRSSDEVRVGGVFVAKFNPAGGVVYSTIVGTGGDGMKVAADANGAAYVSGTTRSASFPTTQGAFQTSGGSDNPQWINEDVFVSKLSPDGSRLVYSTYLGGADGVDRGFGLAVDAQGHAYVAGYTTAPNFPITDGAILVEAGNLFVTKLSANGDGLIYSVIAGLGRPAAVAIDQTGAAYATGDPAVNFATTPGAFENANGASVFVVKVPAVAAPEALKPIPPPLQEPDSLKLFFIGGKIRDASGDRLTDYSVKIVGTNIREDFFNFPQVRNNWVREPDGSISKTVAPDINGYYAAPQAPAGGNYTIVPTKPGYRFTPASQTVNNLGRNVSVSFTAAELATTVQPLAAVSAASFAGSPLASEMIVTAFGTGLATGTASAGAGRLPTNLAGTQVVVRDGLGVDRTAELFFVSPTQINFYLPSGSVAGAATVTAISGDNRVSRANVRIERVAPGLFTADASGRGVAAAVVLRVKATGQQSFEPVAQFDAAQSQMVAVPIDLGPDLGDASDQVFLILYGTGLRYHTALSNVSAQVGGVPAQVTFAGVQGGFVGLDQVNLRLPRSLAGRGEVDVALIVSGKTANTVKVRMK